MIFVVHAAFDVDSVINTEEVTQRLNRKRRGKHCFLGEAQVFPTSCRLLAATVTRMASFVASIRMAIVMSGLDLVHRTNHRRTGGRYMAAQDNGYATVIQQSNSVFSSHLATAPSSDLANSRQSEGAAFELVYFNKASSQCAGRSRSGGMPRRGCQPVLNAVLKGTFCPVDYDATDLSVPLQHQPQLFKHFVSQSVAPGQDDLPHLR
jgi:hypothetical protein